MTERGGVHEVLEVGEIGVLERATRRLNDDRRVGFFCGHHDGLDLLHIVNVKGRHAVAIFGGVIE